MAKLGILEAKKTDLWVDDTLLLSATIAENEIENSVVVRVNMRGCELICTQPFIKKEQKSERAIL